jgi:hypothetical protein
MILGVHGINSDGRDSTDLLLSALSTRGLNAQEFDWGPLGPLSAAALRGHYANRLQRVCATLATPPHIAAHSFGASIVLEALRRGAHMGQVFLFNPAIPADVEFPENRYGHIYVVANQKDRILLWGELLLQWAGYGDLGRTGYLGRSPRVTSIHGPRPAFNAFYEHGEVFTPENLQEWAAFIHRRILDSETP